MISSAQETAERKCPSSNPTSFFDPSIRIRRLSIDSRRLFCRAVSSSSSIARRFSASRSAPPISRAVLSISERRMPPFNNRSRSLSITVERLPSPLRIVSVLRTIVCKIRSWAGSRTQSSNR